MLAFDSTHVLSHKALDPAEVISKARVKVRLKATREWLNAATEAKKSL